MTAGAWKTEEESRTREPKQTKETGQTEGSPISDLGSPTSDLRSLLQPHFIVAVLLLGATLAFSKTIDFREKVPTAKPFSEFPVTVGAWVGQRAAMERKFIDTLDLSDYAIIDYRNESGKMVNFYTAYYESQRKGESIHSPETCLPGAGWVFNEAGNRTIPLTDGKSMPVNRAVMEKPGERELAYYWFPQRGRTLTNAYQLKIYTFWDALTKHRTDGALVRLITPVYDTEDVGEADKRLTSFTQKIVPILDEFIPGKDVSRKDAKTPMPETGEN
jgi:EpsI family protein